MMRCYRFRQSETRRGIAAVEFAVCLPILVLVVFASIEACTMIFLRESLTIAAFESSRVALERGATSTEIIARGHELLNERGVSGGAVQVSPGNLSLVAPGQTIQISVSAPCEANAIIPVWFYGSKSLTSSVTVAKEY